jgi:hypothetical protein
MIQCPCGATDESYVPLCAYDNCHGAYILQKRKDEALLKQALSAMNKVLSGGDFDHPYAELKQVAAAIEERLG